MIADKKDVRIVDDHLDCSDDNDDIIEVCLREFKDPGYINEKGHYILPKDFDDGGYDW